MIDKATLLAALWNNAKPPPEGFPHHSGAGHMNREQAAEHLGRRTWWDYLDGRILKLHLGGNTLDPRAYDRDNGPGLASAVITRIRKTGA